MNRMESRVEAGTTGGPDFSTFASPIDNFLNNYLPKDHETAIRQAIYNALALGVFLGLILGGYYVFVVLQPFVTPIFWAILTGFVIHPYKCSISDTVRATLAHFSASESTVLYVVVHSSCRRSVLLCDTIGGYVFSHLKVLAALLFLFPAFYFAFQLRPTLLYALFDWLAFFWRIPSHPVFQSFQFYHILGLWFLFMASLLFLSKELTTTSWSLRCFSLLTWLIMGCYLSSLLWTSVLHMIGFGVLAFACYRHQSSSSTDNVNSVNSSAPAEPFMSRLQAAILRGFSATFGGVIDGDFVEEESSKEGDSSSEQFLPEEEQLESRDIVQDIPKASALAEKKIPEDGDEGEAVRVTAVQPRSDVDGVMRVKSIIAVDKKMTASTPTAVKNKAPIPEPPNVDVIRHPGVAAIKQQHLQGRSGPSPSVGPTPNRSIYNQSRNNQTGGAFSRRRRFRTTFHLKESIDLTDKASSIYIRSVFWACLIIQFYKHPGLLHLLPIPICVYGVRRIFSYFNLGDPVQKKLDDAAVWYQERKQTLVPWPVQKLGEILFQMERTCLSSLPNYVDGLVTGLLILFLIIALIMSSVFVIFELYSESAYMMQTSGKLFTKMANSTMFKQLNDSIWDPGYQSGFDNMLETAYHSGRDYISQNIHTLVGASEDQTAVEDIESKVLELWDRMYQYWLARKQLDSSLEEQGPSVSKEAITTSVDEIVEQFMENDFFNYASAVQFAKDNMDTLRTILEQTWVLLQGNVRFVMTLVLEILKLLASSGSGFVNGVLSIVVYFTALFYLLANSSGAYKPVEIMSNYGHIFGEGFGDALHKAVNRIFSLTFRMATFYGLWTYLTHTLFDVSIVMVPVLAATFLAAVPVAGQYLVALPAALELWLADDRWLAALLLILCHFLPMMLVDGAIYAEVKGGIHPWLTGLSIVGGIYYFGVAGAIYGPLILCAVFVVLSMYTGFMTDQGVGGGQQTMVRGADKTVDRSRFQTPMFKRSESIF